MAEFDTTGPPRIIDGNGIIIDLRYPDFNRAMRATYNNESRYSTMFNRVTVLNQALRMRPSFEFGYATLDNATAKLLIDGLRNSEFVTLIPRTRAASDSSTAVQRSFKCRVTSNIPFTKPLTRPFSIEIEMVSTEAVGSGVVVPRGTIYVAVTSGNAGGSGGAAQTIYKDNSIAAVNLDGSVQTIAELQGTPKTFVISQTHRKIFVLLTDGTIWRYGLTGGDETFIADVGDGIDLAVFETGNWAPYLFVSVDNPNSGDDFIYRYDMNGENQLWINNSSSGKFVGPGLRLAASDKLQSLFAETIGTSFEVRRFLGTPGDGFDVIQDAFVNNSWGIISAESEGKLYLGNAGGTQIASADATEDSQSLGALTDVGTPPAGAGLMSWDEAGQRIYFADEDIPYWPAGSTTVAYAGPLASSIGAHAIAKVQVIQ
jgi:hypothetical protein